MQEPNFSYEEKYSSLGYNLVIGVDEVGRGAFAGPVVAGAVVLKVESAKLKVQSLGIDDSKKLSPHKREKLVPCIRKYFYCGIGQASVAEINRLGIVKATEKAMRRAINQLIALNPKSKIPSSKQIPNPNFQNPKQTTFILVDAFYVKYVSGVGLKNQKAIIHGDAISISIAAASIIAKVYRDNLMEKLARKYPKYHWGKNKGYGTEVHRNMIRKYGLTKLHRIQFCTKWLKVGQNFL